MDNQELIELLKFKYKTDIEKVYIRFKNRIQIQVRRDILMKLATWLFKEQGFRFIIATASNLGNTHEIVYHFSNDKTGLVLNVQILLPGEKPEIESLVPLFVAADWIEREMHELFGIHFKNHPLLVPLLSEGNWGTDTHPFAKQKQN